MPIWEKFARFVLIELSSTVVGKHLAFLDRPSRRAHTRANQNGRLTHFDPSTATPPPTWNYAMRRLSICLLNILLAGGLVADQLNAQEKSDSSTTSSRTFRPVVRGTQYAVSSMKQEATRAAARILESGGNAFDAIVAGQAVLALVNPESNGLGADAVILVYHAAEKQVYSINAEGPT